MTKKRDRTVRREMERDARRLVRDRERLFELSRGGSAGRPIEVQSSSVIEPRIRSTPCPQCEGTLGVVDHQATSATARKVQVRCAMCGVPRALYFVIVPPVFADN